MVKFFSDDKIRSEVSNTKTCVTLDTPQQFLWMFQNFKKHTAILLMMHSMTGLQGSVPDCSAFKITRVDIPKLLFWVYEKCAMFGRTGQVSTFNEFTVDNCS
jgi:hypothetical protein